MNVDLQFDDFDWDEFNEPKILVKHRIPRLDVEHALATRFTTRTDEAHSAQEPRYVAMGFDRRGRHLFVAFAIRSRGQETLARPISARYMHAKELKGYEERKD